MVAISQKMFSGAFILVIENVCILIKISLKFVPIDNWQ